MKLKKGDEVIILSGKDRGKKGKIESINPRAQTVVLPRLNVYKKHLKKRDEKTPGGIIPLPRPLPVSKVAFICSMCGKQTRIGWKLEGKEKKRMCKKCKGVL